MGRKALAILVISGFAAVGVPASAHHSIAGYEQKPSTIQGVVTAVRWTNPHMAIELAVPTGDGKTETWFIEGGYVSAQINAGLTRLILKPGVTVKVFGRRHRDPSMRMAVLNGVEVNGKYYQRGGGDIKDTP
jgi:hypothetical protein